ncbi:uncharacterized protein LOC128994120 [Macrosteles quadrilineatus]|uniref:uncharacterized protein LOC128994120 n=1 Tax=Macrosteles quadrilineatus TaxID=74068 RepID=UPI0023E1B8D9|nr:uncharacterized protein LOC128994120 [Macrosteles quadrilineatus]
MELLYLVFFVGAILIGVSLENKDYITRIDNLLYEKITNPIVGEGDRLIDSLIVFNNDFNQTIQVYKYNRTNQDVVDMLIRTNGPRCIQVYPNDTLLQIVYEWGYKELGELYYFLNQAKEHWRDFRYYLVNDLHYNIEPLPPFNINSTSF